MTCGVGEFNCGFYIDPDNEIGIQFYFMDLLILCIDNHYKGNEWSLCNIIGEDSTGILDLTCEKQLKIVGVDCYV